MRSTLSNNHSHPSSPATLSIPAPSPSIPSNSSPCAPCSTPFLNPNTCDSTCGPTPVCALRHATATTLVSVLPTVPNPPLSPAGGSDSNGP